LPAPAAWRAWSAFVRRPTLPGRAAPGVLEGLRAIPPLFGLDLAFMAVLLGALGLALRFGLDMPEHMLGELELTPALIAFIVIGAPLGEEIAFRGWLSGRPGHLLATPAVLVALLAMLGAGAAFNAGSAAATTYLLICAIAALFAAGALFFWRKRDALGWFQRHFAWFFWGSALAFAAIHLTNFAAAGPGMLPLVLPQFLLALLLGYLRVTRGLWSAVLLHMLHNALFVSLVLAGAG
jgi:membrane protease YdiL (CAAX protease family)